MNIYNRFNNSFSTSFLKLLRTFIILLLFHFQFFDAKLYSKHDEPFFNFFKGSEQISNLNSNSSLNTWIQINFISPSQEVSKARWWYEAPIVFSAKGMDHLYILTQYVINWLQQPGLPSTLIKEELLSQPKEFLKKNRLKLLSHFWGLLLASAIALCFAIIVSLLGFLLCCCWCRTVPSSKRAKRGDRENTLYTASSDSISPSHHLKRKKYKYQVEKGCDSCLRSFCGTTLFILFLLISFFVICAFFTNEYVRNGFKFLPQTLNQSLDDIELYLNTTQLEVNTLLRKNFNQLQTELESNLDKSGLIIKNRLAVYSKAIALENLTEIVTKLDDIYLELVKLSNETRVLEIHLSHLRIGLEKVRQNLESVFQKCTHPICSNLQRRYKKKMSQFRVLTQSKNLQDLTPLIESISTLLKSGIVHEIHKGKKAFDELSMKIQLAVNDTIPDIKLQFKVVGNSLSNTADDINEVLQIPYTDIKKGKHAVYLGSKYIEKYEIYRWYCGLAGSVILLIILLFYTWGLLCGVCKTQPNLHEYRNRRYKPPTTCPLTFGIVLVFIFFGTLVLLTIVFSLTGIVAEKGVCFFLENPSHPKTKQLISILQKKFEEQEMADSIKIIQGKKPNFADVLINCYQNLSLYHAFQLNKYNRIQLPNNKVIDGFNISNILEFKGRYKIEARLRRFLNNVNVNPGRIVLLSRDGHQLLEKLQKTNLNSFNFASYANLIYQKVTPLDLMNISKEIAKEASSLPPSQLNHSFELKNIAMLLKGYHENYLSDIPDCLMKLNEGAQSIEAKSQYNGKELKKAVKDLLDQAINAQSYIENNGKEAIKEVAENFVRDLDSLIDQYSQHVVDEVENRLGKCEPIWRAINASTLAICKEIVLPFNGTWFSLGSALFLCLLATIPASILAKLFRKLKKSEGKRITLTDSDITLDNLDEDDIPLAQVVNKNEVNLPYNGRRNPPLYLDSTSAAPSAPISVPGDNWSPDAPSSHLYSRPPPYNFQN